MLTSKYYFENVTGEELTDDEFTVIEFLDRQYQDKSGNFAYFWKDADASLRDVLKKIGKLKLDERNKREEFMKLYNELVLSNENSASKIFAEAIASANIEDRKKIRAFVGAKDFYKIATKHRLLLQKEEADELIKLINDL